MRRFSTLMLSVFYMIVCCSIRTCWTLSINLVKSFLADTLSTRIVRIFITNWNTVLGWGIVPGTRRTTLTTIIHHIISLQAMTNTFFVVGVLPTNLLASLGFIVKECPCRAGVTFSVDEIISFFAGAASFIVILVQITVGNAISIWI